MIIHSDGSCLRNTSEGGPGGFAFVAIENGMERQYSLGFHRTTNNRMELLGIITPLQELQTRTTIEFFTDSQYAINALTKWHFKWRRKKWISSSGKPVKNVDLIIKGTELLRIHDVKFNWVKGHNGDYYNELCDVLAKEAAKNPTEVDIGFLKQR